MVLPTQTIFFVNIGIITVIAVCMYSGYRKGFLMKLISILSLLVVGMLAWWLSSPLSRLLLLYPRDATPMKDTILFDFFYEHLNRIFLFVIIFVLLMLALIVIKPLIRILSSLPVVSLVNKLAGCVLGALQALVLLFVVVLVLRLPFWEQGSTMVSQSLLRYSEPMMNSVLFFVKEPLSEVQKLGNGLEQKETFTSKEIEDLRTWLSEKDIDKEKADELLESLRSE